MRDPYSLFVGKVAKQHIWKSGNSYVTPIPTEWISDKMGNARSIEVYKTQIDHWTMVLSVKENPLVESPRRYESKDKDSPLKFESEVFGAYMKGDELFTAHIPINHTKTRNSLNTIPSRLFGAGLDENDSENYALTFKDSEKTAFKPRLEDARKRIEEMYQNNHSALLSFPQLEKFQEQKVLIDTHEKWLDKLSFYMKRLLNKSLFDMELFSRIQIGSRQHMLSYDTIVNNIERIGDLHKEINMTIARTYKRYKDRRRKQVSLKPFAEYLDVSHRMVKSAFDIVLEKESKLALDFNTKFDEELGLEYTEGIYGLEQLKKLVNHIETNPEYTRFLSILQSRIWGLKGNDLNIIEAKLNIAKLR
jgi:hypothetical protein